MHLRAYFFSGVELMYWVSPACPFSQTWYLLRRSASGSAQSCLATPQRTSSRDNSGPGRMACHATDSDQGRQCPRAAYCRLVVRIAYSHVDGSALLGGNALRLLKSLADGARGDLGVLVPPAGEMKGTAM